MTIYYNKGRSDREFQVGAWVYVKTKVYRQTTLTGQPYHKLAPRFYGPYKIVSRIGKLAYRLELPSDAKVHPVFHVSVLKEARGSALGGTSTHLPAATEPLSTPQAVIDRRVRRGRTEVLVHWANTNPAEASWEDLERLEIQFPDIIMADP
ncbi:hypothetical protein LINGRAHAP2_LOCUS7081 [Linum grandiflorum]